MKLNLFLNETAPYRLGHGSFNNRLVVWNVIVFEFLAWKTFDVIIFLTYGLLAQNHWGSFYLDKSVTKVWPASNDKKCKFRTHQNIIFCFRFRWFT